MALIHFDQALLSQLAKHLFMALGIVNTGFKCATAQCKQGLKWYAEQATCSLALQALMTDRVRRRT